MNKDGFLESYYEELRQLEEDYHDDRISLEEFRRMKANLDNSLKYDLSDEAEGR